MIALQSYLRRTSRCLYHPRFASSLGLFDPCFTFSDLTDGKKKWDENSDLVQRGIIARSIIQFVSTRRLFYLTERKTLRQKIIDEAFMKAYIYREIEKNKSPQVEKIKSEWLENERFSFNFSEVVSGFQHNQGYQVQKLVWIQNRMLNAQQEGGSTILNPLSFTGNYFSILKSANNSIVSGTKGIGKSFSFVSYEYLSLFIHHLPLSLQQQQKKLSNHFFNKGRQKKRNLGRILYLSAKNEMDYGKYFKQIIHQLKGIYQMDDILKDTQVKADKQNNYQVSFEKMESFLLDVKKKLSVKKYNFIVVFDQANKLLSLIRKLYQQMKQCQVESKLAQNNKQQVKVRYRESTTYTELKQYSKFIKIIYQTFENILFHSSQEHEKKYTQQFPKQDRSQIQLLKILSESRSFIQKLISYGDFMQKDDGQIQIYEIYYFQISCLLSQLINQQSIQKLRIFFQNTFYKNKQIKKWRNGARFLQIRQVVRNNLELKQQLQKLLKDQPINQGFQKVSKLLKTTKQSIQKLRLEQLIKQNIFEIYLLKAGSSVDALERHSIISNLSIELRKYSQDNKMLPQPNQFIFKNPNISQKNKYILCQTLSFAYVDDNSHIVFQIQPSKLRELLSKIKADQKYNQTLSAIVNVLWADDNFNHEFGRMLDNLSIDCFKNAQFTITIKDDKQNKHLFACIDSVPFIGLHNFSQDSKEALTNFQALIKRANELQGSYVGGYPVKRGTTGQFDSTSEMFDNIIVKMNKIITTQKISKIKMQYEIIVLDWTFGNVNNKIIPKMDKKIQNFFRLTKIQGDVNMTFYLVAPEYQVDRYHQQQKKKPIIMEKQLPNKKFDYKFTYKLASYDKNLPFERNKDEISNISYKLIETLYKRNQKLSKQKIQISKNLINSSKSRE